METKQIGSCPVCGYPVSIEYEGEATVCAYCGANLIAQNGVTIPTPLFVGIVCFFAGMFLGPSLVATTTEGRTWLEKQAREVIRK